MPMRGAPRAAAHDNRARARRARAPWGAARVPALRTTSAPAGWCIYCGGGRGYGAVRALSCGARCADPAPPPLAPQHPHTLFLSPRGFSGVLLATYALSLLARGAWAAMCMAPTRALFRLQLWRLVRRLAQLWCFSYRAAAASLQQDLQQRFCTDACSGLHKQTPQGRRRRCSSACKNEQPVLTLLAPSKRPRRSPRTCGTWGCCTCPPAQPENPAP